MITKKRPEPHTLLQIPDPVVFNHQTPVKTMVILDEVILTGNDKGEISIIEKSTFKLLSKVVLVEAPILKMSTEMYALIVKYKDVSGTVAILKYYKTAKNQHEVKLVLKFESYFVGFTTFASTVMVVKTKEAYTSNICVVTPCSQMQHFPKVWVLNELANAVVHTQTVAVTSNQALGMPKMSANPNNSIREGNIT